MKRTRREWAGCTDLTTKIELLRAAHEEFEASKLKKRLDAGYKPTEVKVERPRIKKTPRKVVISILGNRMTVTYKEYLNRCQGFKIIMEIF